MHSEHFLNLYRKILITKLSNFFNGNSFNIFVELFTSFNEIHKVNANGILAL